MASLSRARGKLKATKSKKKLEFRAHLKQSSSYLIRPRFCALLGYRFVFIEC